MGRQEGDRVRRPGYELVGFDISRAGLFSGRWHATAMFKRPRPETGDPMPRSLTPIVFVYLCLLPGVAPMTDAADTKIPGLTFADDWPGRVRRRV